MEEHRQKVDREFDSILATNSRELETVSQRQAKERERQQKTTVAMETRRRRQMQQQLDADMKQFLAQQKKDYAKWKDDLRKVY